MTGAWVWGVIGSETGKISERIFGGGTTCRSWYDSSDVWIEGFIGSETGKISELIFGGGTTCRSWYDSSDAWIEGLIEDGCSIEALLKHMRVEKERREA